MWSTLNPYNKQNTVIQSKNKQVKRDKIFQQKNMLTRKQLVSEKKTYLFSCKEIVKLLYYGLALCPKHLHNLHFANTVTSSFAKKKWEEGNGNKFLFCNLRSLLQYFNISKDFFALYKIRMHNSIVTHFFPLSLINLLNEKNLRWWKSFASEKFFRKYFKEKRKHKISW